MATAEIQINGQSGSRSDLSIGVPVALSNNGDGGEITWLWELLSVPPGSIASLATPSASTSTLIPDLIGSYRIRLIVNGSITNIAIAAVRTATMNIRIPATGEEGEYDTHGWSGAMYDAFMVIDQYGGNTLDVAYDEGGVGAGRSITADSGAVQIDASGDEALDLDGYASFAEITDPTATGDDRGFLYVKNDDEYGTSDLFYMDDTGQVTQVTQDGYLCVTLVSPNGAAWRLSVDNAGNLITTEI